MSNVQVYFAVGVPSVLVILAWLQANQRAGRIETVMGNLAKDMHSEMITLRDSIHRDMIPLHERMARSKSARSNAQSRLPFQLLSIFRHEHRVPTFAEAEEGCRARQDARTNAP